jgi:dTDP-4-dehydrorhamnose reductase
LRSNVLLLGGSGTLGQALIKSKLIKNLKYPSSKKVNILKLKEIENYILKNNINLILHFAALSKVKECERNKKKGI